MALRVVGSEYSFDAVGAWGCRGTLPAPPHSARCAPHSNVTVFALTCVLAPLSSAAGSSAPWIAQAHAFLSNLEENLFRSSPKAALLVASWLDSHVISFTHMANALAHCIKDIITLPTPFNPAASSNQIAAILSDVAERVSLSPSDHPASHAPPPSMAAAGRAHSHWSSAFLRVLTLGVLRSTSSSNAINAATRGYLARKRFRKAQYASILIVAGGRGYLVRRRALELKLIRDATLVVSYYVKNWVRRRRFYLPSSMRRPDDAS